MKDCKAWIAGVSGTKLTEDEIAFFRDERPWGFILLRATSKVWNRFPS